MSQPKPPSTPRLTLTPEVGHGRYANFIAIAHSYSEVLVDFGHAVPGREDIPVVARVVLHPFHARQLLRTLEHNLAQYERSFGPIPEPPVSKAPSGHDSGTN
jgi:hypothetical protein